MRMFDRRDFVQFRSLLGGREFSSKQRVIRYVLFSHGKISEVLQNKTVNYYQSRLSRRRFSYLSKTDNGHSRVFHENLR